MKDSTDDDLLARARAGDAQALAELLERHQAQIYRFGMKMCRDRSDAEDILQDTLLAMARGVRDFRGASSLSTWLYTIARSYCIKKRRKSKFDPGDPGSLETDVKEEIRKLQDPGKGPEEQVASRQLETALESAIGSLDPEHREVLVLRDVEGLTAPEVAEVLGISVQAVKSRLHRARVAVREQVAPVLGIPEGAPAPGAAPCPDVLTLFSEKLEGDISPSLCGEMERHLESCGRCRARCDSLKRTLALCQTAPAPGVPPAVQESVRQAIRDLLSVKVP